MTDTKYVEIFIDKNTKTQRLVFSAPDDCSASICRKLKANHNIDWTTHKFVGRLYETRTLDSYKEHTYKYAQNYTWVENIDVSEED